MKLVSSRSIKMSGPVNKPAGAASRSPIALAERPAAVSAEGAARKPLYREYKPRRRGKKLIIISLSVLLALTLGYLTAVYSDVPFIAKWRTIYIETAMQTMSHQWLATAFIPKPVVDKVMRAREDLLERQKDFKSQWDAYIKQAQEDKAAREAAAREAAAKEAADKAILEAEELAAYQKALIVENFYNLFSELDRAPFEKYLGEHPELLENGYDSIFINETSLSKSGTGLYTKQGDEILAVDAENGILILRVFGKDYVGKLAIIKDASRVNMVPASHLGAYGDKIGDIVKNNDAVLGINASGFADYEGVGNGGAIDGLLISGGKKLANRTNGYYYSIIGFGYDDRLYVGQTMKESDFRDAVEFYPAEIINGKDVTAGSSGFGIQPRTSIGQTAAGDVLLLTIDGRLVGYSLGTTVGECATIFLRYGAVQASNLDGGASTVMYYMGEYITKPANSIQFGRYCPDAVIVRGVEK